MYPGCLRAPTTHWPSRCPPPALAPAAPAGHAPVGSALSGCAASAAALPKPERHSPASAASRPHSGGCRRCYGLPAANAAPCPPIARGLPSSPAAPRLAHRRPGRPGYHNEPGPATGWPWSPPAPGSLPASAGPAVPPAGPPPPPQQLPLRLQPIDPVGQFLLPGRLDLVGPDRRLAQGRQFRHHRRVLGVVLAGDARDDLGGGGGRLGADPQHLQASIVPGLPQGIAVGARGFQSHTQS